MEGMLAGLQAGIAAGGKRMGGEGLMGVVGIRFFLTFSRLLILLFPFLSFAPDLLHVFRHRHLRR